MLIYLGVDVSEATLDVAYAYDEQEAMLKSYDNRPAGWKLLGEEVMALAATLGESTIQLIIEPTGGYERGFVEYAFGLEWQVTIVNPYYVRRFIQGQGQRGKSDTRDALMLARYGKQKQPAAQEQMDQDANELKGLNSRKDDLKKLVRSERNRLKQAKHDPATPVAVLGSIERTIKMLEEEQKALDGAVKELLRRSKELGKQEVLLRTVPGVGKQVVLRILTLFYRFQAATAGKGTSSQLVAYLGLDPQPYESGRTVRKRTTISRMGNKLGRADLFMAALGGVRGKNPLRSFYHHLQKRGKAKKLALVACSRKILVWAWAVFTSGQRFDPQRVLPKTQIAS
jgi:transposase